MLLSKLREKLTPIKIEQTTLNKFFPELPEPTDDSLPSEIESRMALSKGDPYHLGMKRDGTVYIRETHCLKCGKRLSENGCNPRTVIFDNGLGKQDFRLHRKICKKCGEIKPFFLILFLMKNFFDFIFTYYSKMFNIFSTLWY